MTNELQVFSYTEQHKIRTTVIDGDPWFVAKDVANALGYKNPQEAIREHVDDEDKGVSEILTPGGKQKAPVINESGMYSLIFASKLPSAKQFKHWVTSEVLPSIRKHGLYLTGKTAEEFEKLAARCSALELQVAEMKQALTERYSFSVLGETVLAQQGAITVKEAAGFLAQHGTPIGQNRLFKYCRDIHLLCSRKGNQWNKPTQKAIDAGLFNLEIAGGFRAAALVTPKGLHFLTDKLVAERYPLLVLIEKAEIVEADK